MMLRLKFSSISHSTFPNTGCTIPFTCDSGKTTEVLTDPIMLSRLCDLLKGNSSPGYPSAILTLELPTDSRTIYALHIVPETGEVETFGQSRLPTLHLRYAKEKSREQLGTVFLHVGDGESPFEFLDQISASSVELLSEQKNSASLADHSTTADETLRSAALEGLRQRENREAPKSAAQLYNVHLIKVERSRPGKVLGEPRSVGP